MSDNDKRASSDTPRVDALIAKHTKQTREFLYGRSPSGRPMREHATRQAHEVIHFARQLERELADALEKLETIRLESFARDLMPSDIEEIIANETSGRAREDEEPIRADLGWLRAHHLTEAMDALDEYAKSQEHTPAFELGVMASRNIVRKLMDLPEAAAETMDAYWQRMREASKPEAPEVS